MKTLENRAVENSTHNNLGSRIVTPRRSYYINKQWMITFYETKSENISFKSNNKILFSQGINNTRNRIRNRFENIMSKTKTNTNIPEKTYRINKNWLVISEADNFYS